ncbi:MAG: TipAS antibiotic-recognition domain-containing protein [Spirochaetales bacterium]|nr:TipAS antibiotic-recognition domain-containing protein [Spirochaetales bacterium]
MSKKEMFQAFDMTEIKNHQKKYADEVKQKYGHTREYEESLKKTSGYTKKEWAAIMARGNEIYSGLAALTDREPCDPEVQKIIGEWRQHITESFYTCTLEICRGLADMYVNDSRFTKNINKHKPGLTNFMRDVIHYYYNNHKEE